MIGITTYVPVLLTVQKYSRSLPNGAMNESIFATVVNLVIDRHDIVIFFTHLVICDNNCHSNCIVHYDNSFCFAAKNLVLIRN